MPTNDRLSLTAALARLRAQAGRLRRSVMSRRPAVRWGAALVVVIGLTALLYCAATSFTTLGLRYLIAGRRFSSDDLIKEATGLRTQPSQGRGERQAIVGRHQPSSGQDLKLVTLEIAPRCGA